MKIKSIIFSMLVAFSIMATPAYAGGVNDWVSGEGDGYVYKYNCNGLVDADLVIFTNLTYMTVDDNYYMGLTESAGLCWIGVLFLDDEHQFVIDFDMANAAELRDYVWDNSDATLYYRQGGWRMNKIDFGY